MRLCRTSMLSKNEIEPSCEVPGSPRGAAELALPIRSLSGRSICACVVPPNGVPNVLLIITDDAGYGVPSTIGGVIPTPALDRIAQKLCSPTRAALITGRNHHSVGYGVIAEQATGYAGYDSVSRVGPQSNPPRVVRSRSSREAGSARRPGRSASRPALDTGLRATKRSDRVLCPCRSGQPEQTVVIVIHPVEIKSYNRPGK